MGKRYESRLRIFTEPKFKEEAKAEEGFKDFLKFMRTAISEEKANRIVDFIQYPLTSVDITEGIMDDLYKVFNAGNSFFDVRGVKENGGREVNELLDRINLNNWIEEEGKKVLKNKPNTVVVVDKDEEGEPYLIAVGNERLIDFEFKKDFVSFEYIAFLHSIETDANGKEEERIALYDEENYNVLLRKNGKVTVEKQTPHGLEFCPARMFVSKRLNSDGELNRRSPFASVLSKLQEWQLFDIYKFYTDHYAPFPVIEMVRAKCGNDNCSNGMIEIQKPYNEDDKVKYTSTFVKCESCGNSNSVGIGAKVLIDPQVDKDTPTAKGIFKFITPEVTNLEYLEKKLKTIEEYIELKVIGAGEVLTKEAVNEKQVKGSFESKTNVLLSIKTELDNLYKWIVTTLAALKVGADKPMQITANFGTEWYLEGEDKLQERYKQAKEMGLPLEEVDMIYSQLIETKYKGNPKKIARLKTINSLDPCPYLSQEEKATAYQNRTISKKEFIISEKMPYFVRKFEREQGALVDFGITKTEGERLKNIYIILNKYADEFIKEVQAEQDASGEKAGGE